MADPSVRERFAAKTVQVPGSDCLWWVGAVSGRGHGRFWIGGGFVAIAHRYAYAVASGVEQLHAAPMLGHRCDNPLCQRIGPEHVVASTARENRLEWVSRRDWRDSPLADPAGARSRAESLRALARRDPRAVRDEIERRRALLPEQLGLW